MRSHANTLRGSNRTFKKRGLKTKMNAENKTLMYQEPFAGLSKIPKIELKGVKLVVNGKSLNLNRKARAFRVVRAFFNCNEPALSVSELMSWLRKDEGIPVRQSERADKFEKASITRIISRMRAEFESTFKSATPIGFRWFHFDKKRNHWVLFRMPATGADGVVY
jgi:hypothetical protein